MTRRRTLVVLVAVVAMLSLGGRSVAMAQGATPAARSQQPIVPAANQCTVAPRDIAFLAQFAGTPAAAVSPVATPAGLAAIQMPAGEAPDRATRQGVLDTIRQAAACINAGNTLAYSALFTDAFISNDLAVAPLSDAAVAALETTPVPLTGDQMAAILAIVDVRVLADGRVAVLVDFDDPTETPPGPTRELLILVQKDGRWLIDEQRAAVPIDASQVGQPSS